jgi:hypothetical protein
VTDDKAVDMVICVFVGQGQYKWAGQTGGAAQTSKPQLQPRRLALVSAHTTRMPVHWHV